MPDDMIDFNECLALLNIDKKDLRELISKGQIKAYSAGGSFTFKRREIEAYAAAHKDEIPTVIVDDDIDVDDLEIDAAPAETTSDDYDGLDIGGLDVEAEPSDAVSLEGGDIAMDDEVTTAGSDTQDDSDKTLDVEGEIEDVDLEDVSLDDIDLSDLEDDAKTETTLSEISLDSATDSGITDAADATHTVALDSDTGATEELDLGNETLDIGDDNLFPDSAPTGEVTSDFELENDVTGEIAITDPIDVTADMGDGMLSASAAAPVGRIAVRKENDVIWMIMMIVALISVLYTGFPVSGLMKDYVPEYLKSTAKNDSWIPKGGGIASESSPGNGRFDKIMVK
ncbi:MAG: helix-turn-helix domain-containing protein [Planctomycetota bacterium]